MARLYVRGNYSWASGVAGLNGTSQYDFNWSGTSETYGTIGTGKKIAIEYTPVAGYHLDHATEANGLLSFSYGNYYAVSSQNAASTNYHVTMYFAADDPQYTVYLNPNGGTWSGGGTGTVSQTGTSGTSLNTNVSRSHYTFNGWKYYSSSSGAYIYVSTISSGINGITLYADWVEDPKYTTTFNVASNGGYWNDATSSHSNKSYTAYSGTAYTDVLEYSVLKDGHTFDGWYTDGGIRSTVFTTSNKTVYARFTANTYNVTINSGGNGSVSPTTISSVAYGTSYSASGNTLTIGSTVVTATPTSGYQFKNWSSTSGTITGAKTFTAYFEPATYQVSFNGSQHAHVNPSSISVPRNTTYAVVSGEPNKLLFTKPDSTTITVTASADDGYMFNRWSSSSGTVTSDITITAYGRLAAYTLTVSASPAAGGTVTKSPNESEYEPGTVVTVQATANSGYTFHGWSDSSSTNPRYITMNEDKSLTANFTAGTYKIYYRDESGTTVEQTQYAIYHDTVTLNSNADTKTYTTNIFFYIDDTLVKTLRGGSTVDSRTSWKYISGSSYTSFNLGHTFNSYPYHQDIYLTEYRTKVGSWKTITTPEADYKEGYIFRNWNTKSDGTGAAFPESTEIYVGSYPALQEQTVRLYAIYDTKYRVNYNGNGGTPSQAYQIGKAGSPLLATATKSGYIFKGWTVRINEWTQLFDDFQTIIPGQGNPYTVYAYWENRKLLVKFYNGVVAIETRQVTQGDTLKVLPHPTREGYTLEWWTQPYGKGTKVTENTVINEDSNFYAYWIVNKYDVTAKEASGSAFQIELINPKANETLHVDYGDSVLIQARPYVVFVDTTILTLDWYLNGIIFATATNSFNYKVTCDSHFTVKGVIRNKKLVFHGFRDEETVIVQMNTSSYYLPDYTDIFKAVTPAGKYDFDCWHLNGYQRYEPGDLFDVTTAEYETHFYANFIQQICNIKTDINDWRYGQITKNPDKVNYDRNETVTITCTPLSGYYLDHWEIRYPSDSSSVWKDTTNPFTLEHICYDASFTAYVYKKEEGQFTPIDPGTSGKYDTLSKYYYSYGYLMDNGELGLNGYTGYWNPTSSSCPYGGNCTWWAYGRTAEICGKDIIDICSARPDAGVWFGSNDVFTGWEREGGTVGQLVIFKPGDIICYENHVEIVEQILEDGKALISYSAWWWPRSGDAFKTVIREGSMTVGVSSVPVSGYFLGVIHNPYTSSGTSYHAYTLVPESKPFGKGQVLINGSEDKVTVTKGASVTLSAVDLDSEEYPFIQWWDGNISRERTFTPTYSMTIWAQFGYTSTEENVIVNIIPENSGIVTGAGTYEIGEDVTLTFTAIDGYEFDYWENSARLPGHRTENPYSFKASEKDIFDVHFNYVGSSSGGSGAPTTYQGKFLTVYGIGSEIKVNNISLDVESYSGTSSSKTNVHRPAMKLIVGSQEITIPTSSTTTWSQSFSPAVSIDSTNNIILKMNETDSTRTGIKITSITITGESWNDQTGVSTYCRHYDGTAWTEWTIVE